MTLCLLYSTLVAKRSLIKKRMQKQLQMTVEVSRQLPESAELFVKVAGTMFLPVPIQSWWPRSDAKPHVIFQSSVPFLPQSR